MSEGTRRCPRCGRAFGDEVTRCPDDGTALISSAQPVDPLLGLEVDGRYTVRAPLGQGGMGRVYRAYQHSIGREVAFKVMSAGAQDEASRRRFVREAQLLGQLNHPGIVAAVDFGQLPDRSLYLVMELLEGESLTQLVRRHGALAAERVVEIGRQICDALGAAHHRGIVHRDLKPSNVVRLAGARDVVKVLDFGLARPVNDVEQLTESGVVLGSAQFMAPELMDGVEASPASDLYSLGAILYVLANGRLPFGPQQGFTVAAQRQARGAVEPFEPLVNARLQQLIRRLLATSPSARPASAELVREMLTAVLEAPPSVPVVPPASRAGWVVGALAVVGVATGVGAWWSQRGESEARLPIGATAAPVDAGTKDGLAVELNDAGTDLTAQQEEATDAGPTQAAVLDTVLEPRDAGSPKRPGRAPNKAKRDPKLPGDWLP